MSISKVHNFIRNILQNSKLNREKFVKNKQIYNKMLSKNKNYNLIIKRNYGTHFPNQKFNNNNNNNNRLLYLIIAVLSIDIAKKIREN